MEWIKAKSIRPKESGMSDETLAFLISRSIHKNGYKGKGNIFKDVLTKARFASLTRQLIVNEATVIKSNILKEFKFQ